MAEQGLFQMFQGVRLCAVIADKVFHLTGNALAGGQPQQPGYVRNTVDIRGLRAKVLYDSDKNNPIRKSHENPAIKELYATFLGEPGSEKAHHLLHTTYIKRKVNEI